MSLLPALPRRPSTWSISSASQPPTPASGPVSRSKSIIANDLTTFNPQTLLRHTERVLITQSCRVRSGFAPFVKADALLVSSKTESGDEAAIFIMTPPTESEAASILYTIPIIPGFKHRLEQTPPSPSTSFFQQSAKPHITLYLSCEEVKLELRISASQSAKVQKLVAELRRLNEVASQSPVPRSLAHPWLALYPSQRGDSDPVDELVSPQVGTPGVFTPSTSTGTMTVDTPLTSAAEAVDTELTEETEHPDPFLPTFSRTTFLRKRLFARQDKWSNQSDIRIRIATYNVNDKIPPEGTLELAPLAGKGEEDILVFGFQEADLRRQSLLISQGNGRAEGWEAALFAGLGPKAADFEKYVGVMMIVLVRKTLKEAITRVETSEKGIGLLGFGGNKAGVAVRLKVHDTTFCFVNAHMAAFATALDRRRSDYQVLKAGLTFTRPTETDLTPAFEEFLPEAKEKLLNQEDSHILFWLGDLNYRIDLPDNDVKKLVEEKKWDEMLAKDQLRLDIASEQSFARFSEPDITFPPTFKYVHGSTTHDLRRGPAYTDRIIHHLPSNSYTSPSSFNLKCNEYTSHEILWSDHRPVSATYTASVRVIDEGSRAVEFGGVMKDLDKLEEVYRPSLEIEGTSLEFGQVRYRQPVQRAIKLRNIGRVPATYSFKPPSSDKPISKPFMWPFPVTAVVEPGQSISLTVVIFVNETWSAKLTSGDDINDVLVLQIEGGKDFFITCQASWQPSIISLPLHVLSALPTPIREVSLADRKILARPLAPSTTNGEAPAKPVRDVWRLLEYLMAKGKGVEGLWTEKEDVLGILEHLDAGSELPEDQCKQVSAALLHILAALPTPLLPASHHATCLIVQDRDAAFAVLEGVPQINTNVLIGLMSVVKLCTGLDEQATLQGPKKETIDVAKAGDETSKSPQETETGEGSGTPAAEIEGNEKIAETQTNRKSEIKASDDEAGKSEDFVIEDDEDEEETGPEKEEPLKKVIVVKHGNQEETKDDIDSIEGVMDEISLTADQPGDPEQSILKDVNADLGQDATQSDSEEKVVAFASPPKKGSGDLPVTPPAQVQKLPEIPPSEPSEELVDALCPAIFGQTVSVGSTKDKRRRFVKLLLEG